VTVRSRDLLAEADDLPDHEVVRLLMAAADRNRSDVLIGFDVSVTELETFRSFVDRRRADEPLQYIEGTVPFGPVVLHVDPRVLIPRPETEHLFELVVSMVDSPRVIVDLCTGSGNLALALAASFPDAEVFAVDLSEGAVDVACLNAAENDLDVSVLVGDLFDPLPDAIRGRVDLLVSNPPYLAEAELASLPAEVLEEPVMALVAGSGGDEVLASIAAEAGEWLAPGGVVACEISEFHGGRVAELFSRYDATIGKDLAGRDRYVLGSLRFG
jgi:release factor glutamine methyltransferase